MKTKLLAATAMIGGLALAGTAGAQIVGGAVGGTVGGALGQPGAGVSGGVSAGVNAQTPPVNSPGVGLPPVATPSTAAPLPRTIPSVTAPGTSASVNGAANANANANVASATAPVNLTGLAPGMMVRDAKGRALGKVSRVVKRADGTISAVEVAAAQQAGRTMSLEPSTLSVSSGVVTYSNASATPK